MNGFAEMDRYREFFEYNVRPSWALLRQGELGFLFGAIAEKIIGRNPYFRYRECRGKDSIVRRQVRDYEMYIDLYDRGLSRHLFISGTHEEAPADAYRAALKEVRDEVDGKITVLDVGANIGYYVLEEANVLSDDASIIAFEPDPENRSLLKTNIELNNCADKVEILQKAVDKTSGEKVFCQSTHSNWNRIERNGIGNDDDLVNRFLVKTTSIDDFLDEREIEPEYVNALRMDLEGHEISVLRGMLDILSSDTPLVLFIEFHPDRVERADYEWAISMLEEQEFKIRFAGQKWKELDLNSFKELQAIDGSHIRVILFRV